MRVGVVVVKFKNRRRNVIVLIITMLLVLIHSMTILFKGQLLPGNNTFTIAQKAIMDLGYNYGYGIAATTSSDNNNNNNSSLHKGEQQPQQPQQQQQQEQHSCPDGFFYFQDHQQQQQQQLIDEETVPVIQHKRRRHKHETTQQQQTNVTAGTNTNTNTTTRLIPRIIHMASNSRCLSPNAWKVAQFWIKEAAKAAAAADFYSIRLYDETDMDHELLNDNDNTTLLLLPPHLPLVVNACLPLFNYHHDNQFQVKMDLFKYFILYRLGGIFVDLTLSLSVFGDADHDDRDRLVLLLDDINQHNDDAVLIFDNYNNNNSSLNNSFLFLPSHTFLATSPQHPIMFLAMTQSLLNIGSKLRNNNNTLAVLPDVYTGPVALYEAFQSFLNFDKNIFPQPHIDTNETELQQQQPSFLHSGTCYTGLEQRTVTVHLLQKGAEDTANANTNGDAFISSEQRWMRQTTTTGAGEDSILRIPLPPLSPPWATPIPANVPVPQCPLRIYNAIASSAQQSTTSVSQTTTTTTDTLPLSYVVTGHRFSESGNNDKSSTTICPPGLVRFNDRILPESITHTTSRKIPKIIHVTGKTRCLSPGFYENLEKWKQLENHSMYFHDDDAVHRLLNKNWSNVFPHLHLVLPCIQSGAGLADLWRYLVLWEYGGIYSDMDSAPGPNLQNGTAITNDDDAFLIIERGRFLAQYWMSASSHHPLMFHAAFQALQNLMQLPDTGQQYVPVVTGPRALVDGWELFLGQRGPSARYPKAGFYVGLVGNDNNNNRTATVKGSKRESNLWVQRVAVPSKNTGYASMGIVNYRYTQMQANNVSCFSLMLQTMKKTKD